MHVQQQVRRPQRPAQEAGRWPAGLAMLIGCGYVLVYILLDWASFVQPVESFAITPWNPGAGWSYALILIFGSYYLPLLPFAAFLAELIVRDLPAPPGILVLTSCIIGIGIAVPTLLLRSGRLGFDPTLPSARDVFLLIGAGMAGAAATAIGYVLCLTLSGQLPWNFLGPAVLRFWVGDVIGITVVAPFLLKLAARQFRLTLSLEGVLQLTMVVAALWVVFGGGAEPRLQLFYVLFLPIIWVAVRHGLEGACMGLVATQIGLMAAIELTHSEFDITSFQAVMVVLALTGLALGAVVSERRRAELELRLQQEAQARLARLASLGELSAAIAHEINQPLAAAATYTRLVADALESDDAEGQATARVAAEKARGQVQRAADVIRRLRELVRLGRKQFAPVSLSRLVSDALEPLKLEVESAGIALETRLPQAPITLSADVVHIQLVVANLVRNSMAALKSVQTVNPRIVIEAEAVGSEEVELRMIDNGPGFPTQLLENPFEPFVTSRAEGLGIGLSLSRSIIEAHGGRIRLGNMPNGAIVRITLKRTVE